jgi:hypothetical protein
MDRKRNISTSLNRDKVATRFHTHSYSNMSVHEENGESDVHAFTTITFVFTVSSCQSGLFLSQTSCNNSTSFSAITALKATTSCCKECWLVSLKSILEQPPVTHKNRTSSKSTEDDSASGKGKLANQWQIFYVQARYLLLFFTMIITKYIGGKQYR